MIPPSVLSYQFRTEDTIKASLDYFAEEATGISLRSHLRSQLLRLKEVSGPEKYVFFSVIVKNESEKIVLEIFRELRLEQCLNAKKSMYIFEKHFNYRNSFGLSKGMK